jgi:Rv0078B-related antitoxin
MRALDTTPEIAEMQARIHKSMTGEQRLLLALEMSYLSHAFAKAGIRSRHPDWSDEQVTREFRRSLFAGAVPPGL